MKDTLFIVPAKTLSLHGRIIKTTLWAVKSESTYTVMSADAFVDRYGGIPAKDAAEKLRKEYKGICNVGTLSKREEKAYREIMNPCIEVAQKERDA